MVDTPLTEVLSPSPLQISQAVLAALQTELDVRGRDRVPQGPFIVASNHRSLMDPFVIMVALQHNVRFACHYFMTRVPLLNLAIAQLQCIPLEQHGGSQKRFVRAALTSLRQRQAVGVFPEGGALMTRRSNPHQVAEFQQGFARLALRSPITPLAILPVALKVDREILMPEIPMPLFRWFDSKEPAFQTNHPHPVVLYRKLEVEIAPPIWIPCSPSTLGNTDCLRQTASDLTRNTQATIRQLLYS